MVRLFMPQVFVSNKIINKSMKSPFFHSNITFSFAALVLLGATLVSCQQKRDSDSRVYQHATDDVEAVPKTNSYAASDSSHVSSPMRAASQTTVAPADEAYDEGYSNGYDAGLEDGINGFARECNYDDLSRYHSQSATRYREGYEVGYEEGFEEGSAYDERRASGEDDF